MSKPVTLVLAALCVFGSPGVAQGPNAVKAEITIAHSFADQPIPKWENGHFVAWQFDPPTIRLFDRSGTPSAQMTIDIPGATGLMLTDIGVSADGALAAAGAATASDGAGAAYIEWLDRSGRVLRVVRTSPFVAYRVCFAPDGSLWAIGAELKTLGPSADPEHHNVLRQYRLDGTLQRALLPRNTFRAYDRRHPAIASFVAASKDRVGVYSVPAREWIEVSPTGTFVGRWNAVDNGSTIRTWTVALTPAGSVYASAALARSRMQVYKLDRAAGTWLPIDARTWVGPDASGVTVFGIDGPDLVISPKLPKLVWVSEQ